MRVIRQTFVRLADLLLRRRADERLSAEIEEHIFLQTEENIRSGMSPVEARRQALLRFGAVETIKESYRGQQSIAFVESLLQDLQYSFRVLRKNLWFTAVAVITLAVGIGANTAILSVAEGIWLNPLPFTDSASLLWGGEKTPDGGRWTITAAIYRAWQQQAHSFSSAAAYIEDAGNVTGIAVPEHISIARVTPDLFPLLNSTPLLGRLWTAQESAERRSLAVLSYGQWQTHFGADPAILGRGIIVNGNPVTIIGVMPSQFTFPSGDELWMPLAFTEADWADATGHRVHVIARLRPGVSIQQANQELASISKALAQENPAAYRDRVGAVLPIRDYLNGNLTPIALRVMFALVVLVLLIACVNVGGLQLARATSRRREFAMRAALGGGGWRLAQQLLVESLLLSLLGATLGVVLAHWADRLLVSGLPADIARQIAGWSNISLDSRTLWFTALAAIGAGVLSGVAPAIGSARVMPGETFKGQTSSEAREPQRLRTLLIAAEAAMAVILVVSTALVLKGFHNIMASVERFAPKEVITAHVDFSSREYGDAIRRTAFIEESLGRLRAIPGATGAVVFTSAPFSNNGVDWQPFAVSGKPQPRNAPTAVIQNISPGFFSEMHIPLLSGRDFSDADGPKTLPVAVVSEKFAQRWWPKQSALGQTVELQSAKTSLTIVGIASDVEYDWTDNAPEPVIYVPYTQLPPSSVYFGVRSAVPLSALVPEVRAALAAQDRDLPVDISSLATVFWYSMSALAEMEGLMGSFGLIALLLAAVGVYGTVAFSVSQRTREIAIRMAVGAQRTQVLRVVVERAMFAITSGIAVGVFGALLMGRVVGSFFFGTSGVDLPVMVTATAALISVTLVASIIPARHATTIQPIEALRYE
jgi:predicted permease